MADKTGIESRIEESDWTTLTALFIEFVGASHPLEDSPRAAKVKYDRLVLELFEKHVPESIRRTLTLQDFQRFIHVSCRKRTRPLPPHI